MNQNIPLAVILTVVSTLFLAVAATVQHYAVGEKTDEKSMLKGSELLSLLKSPRWLLGLVLSGVGALIQVVALLLAPVTVVQPIGILAVPWTILLATRIHRHTINPMMWVATLLTVGGTAGFALVAIRAAVEHPLLNDGRIVIGVIAGFVVALGMAALGARGPAAWRCFFWSSAGAFIYGLEAGIIKTLGEYTATRDWVASTTFWFLVATLVIGMLLATVLVQQGYASGPAEIVVGSINASAPVAAVLFGVVVLGEGVNLTPVTSLAMVAAAAVAISGVVLLSRFHPSAVASAGPAQ